MPFSPKSRQETPLLLTYVPDQPVSDDTVAAKPENGAMKTDVLSASPRVGETIDYGRVETSEDAGELLSLSNGTETAEANLSGLTLRKIFQGILTVCPPSTESRALPFLRLLARSIRRCEWQRALQIIAENRPALPEIDAVEGLIHLASKRPESAEPFLEKALQKGSTALRPYVQEMLLRAHTETKPARSPKHNKPREYNRPGSGGKASNRSEGGRSGLGMYAPGKGNDEYRMEEVAKILEALEVVQAQNDANATVPPDGTASA